jgi:riboflavin kinase
MKKDTYRQQYQEKLGFIPYNGTLNVKLKNDVEINLKEKFNDKLKIIKGNENLGDVYFLEAEIYTLNKEVSEKGAILFPTKTVHKIDTIEFVAKNRFREKMNLKDNTQVIVSIDY